MILLNLVFDTKLSPSESKIKHKNASVRLHEKLLASSTNFGCFTKCFDSLNKECQLLDLAQDILCTMCQVGEKWWV